MESSSAMEEDSHSSATIHKKPKLITRRKKKKPKKEDEEEIKRRCRLENGEKDPTEYDPTRPVFDFKGPLLKCEAREFWFTENMLEEDEKEAKLGIHLLPHDTHNKLGWLLTFATGLWKDPDSDKVYSCVDLYFISEDRSTFKCKSKFNPYFYVIAEEGMEKDADKYLRERYEDKIVTVEMVQKEGIDLAQRSPCKRRSYLKVYFETVKQLIDSREDLIKILEMKKQHYNKESTPDLAKCVLGCAEADIPYHARFAIDNDIRCGQWYSISTSYTSTFIQERTDISQPAEVCVCALHVEYVMPPRYNIGGPIVMISYMVDGKGYLLVNQEFVGEDIKDFYCTSRLGDEGRFEVANMKNEVELLRFWFAHMRCVKPCIYVTCNGDMYDWESVVRRAAIHEIVVNDEIGIGSETFCRGYRSKFACHIDCFEWLRRDQSLSGKIARAIAQLKFHYSEDRVRVDKGLTQWLASHSVSEAVTTSIIYRTCVHPYIFSLSAKLPLPPDEIMRLPPVTLCRLFSRAEAYNAGYVVLDSYVEKVPMSDYPVVHGQYASDSEWLIDTKRVDGECLRECLWYAEEKGFLALVRKLYNQMRAEHHTLVRESVEQALKVKRSSIENETIYNISQENNANFIDLSWMFPNQDDVGELKEFKFPVSCVGREDLDSWTIRERANLKFRMFKAFQDLGVSLPIGSFFSKESLAIDVGRDLGNRVIYV